MYQFQIEEVAMEAQSPDAAFEHDAFRHLDVLYEYARLMTGDLEEASSLVRKSYLNAYRTWTENSHRQNVRTELIRFLRGSIVSNSTSGHRERQDPENDLEFALQRLPEELRSTLILCDHEGFSYHEIAECLDCPIDFIPRKLHEARLLIRGVLEPMARESNV
jgi:DNA-directed RNA polymerase specialized sigma24 family protein